MSPLETSADIGSDVDGVFQDVTQRARRAFPTDALVIAVADERTGTLRAAHAVGFDETPASLTERLRDHWEEALIAKRVVRHDHRSCVELSAALLSRTGALGAITLSADVANTPARIEEAEHLLTDLAAQASAGVERARLVRQRERKQRLDAVAETAAAIAHELRNPLFGISSAAQLLRFRAREDPVLERNVGRILREVERLNSLIGDLLELGAPRPLAPAPTDPDALWDDVLSAHRGLLESRALKLERARAKHHVKIPLDRDRMREVFLNALSTASDLATDSSTIALSSETDPDGGWRCTLRAQGEIIASDDLERAFELFFTTKRSGTGLGLAMARRIVEEHGGSVRFERDDTGMTLTISVASSS
jgi:signal transduction histidine kinase